MAIDFGSVASTAIDIGYGSALDNPGALSIAMWFRLNANDGAADEICSHMNAGADGWLLRMTGSNGIRFRTDNGVANEEDSATDTFTVGTWAHLGFTWSGTAVNFYIDGTVDSGGELAHTQVTTGVGEVMTVGKRVNGSAPMSWAHLLIWDSNIGVDGIVAAMNGTLVDTDNLKLWVRANGTPSYNSIDGTVGTVGEGTPASLAEHLAHKGRGVPGFQDLFFDSGPQINRQDLMFDSGPHISQPGQAQIGLEPGPHMGQVGHRARIDLEPGPFLNPLKHVLDGFGTEGLDAGVPGRGNTPTGLLGFRNEESVTTPGTSSETVTKLAPSTISTTWTKGYSAITTLWKKGRHSYE